MSDILAEMPQDFIFHLPDGTPVLTGNITQGEKEITLTTFADGVGVWTRDQIAKVVTNPKRKMGRKRFAGSHIKNQGRRGSCFPAGTLVRMGDGSQKPIEKVGLLDKVLTAEGNVRNVIRTMVRDCKDGIYKLKLWGHRHLLATEEHPVLTKNGYKKIANLTKDDWVAIPKFMPQQLESINPYLYTRERTLRAYYTMNKSHSQTIGVAGRVATEVTTKPLPELIKLDSRFGFLVGLFLAEGSASERKIKFHFHTKEMDTLGKFVVDTFKELFDIDCHVRIGRGGKPNNLDVTVYGKLWAELFVSLCSTGSKHKELNQDLCNAPKEFLECVLNGWQAGDGLGRDEFCGGVTISHKLAMNMFDIANALGHRATVETLDVKVNPKHKIKARQKRYQVKWPRDRKPCVSEKSFETETHVYRKVFEVEKIPFEGHVYNLEVEGDHSYVAEGVGVHNCNAYAIAAALEKARELRGLPRVVLGPEFLYAQINGGRDSGSQLKDGWKAAENIGIPPVEFVKYESYLKREQSPEATANAGRFKILKGEAYGVHSDEELATALALGWVCVVACHVTNAWMNLDSNGVVEATDGPGNHAIHCDDIRINSRGEYEYDHAGSWGTRYGQDGRGWTTWKRHYRTPSKYHQFYAVRSTTDDPNDPNQVPKRKAA